MFYFKPVVFVLSVLLLTFVLNGRYVSHVFSAEMGLEAQPYNYHLQYMLDRTAVPSLTHNELTVQISVGAIQSYAVFVDGVQLTTDQYDSQTGQLMVTTAGSALEVFVETVEAPTADFGQIMVAELKDDKAWAWSHGFDDNTLLANGMALFESYGWRGTLFLITSLIDDNRDQEWIVDAPGMIRALDRGWSVGSHSWAAMCDDFEQQSIEQSLTRLSEIVAKSTRPDYKITSFAAPCFISDYHPIVLTIRDEGNHDLLFNESGGDFLLVVDREASGGYSADGLTANRFSYDAPVGRDAKISYISDLGQAVAAIDWMAEQASADRHFWYNTLAHGSGEAYLEPVLAHVYNNYGPGGTDEVWVAPSDEIYGYMLVRDYTDVKLISITSVKDGDVMTPVPPTSTPTEIPTQTPVSTVMPTQTPVSTVTPTQTPVSTVTPTQTPIVRATPLSSDPDSSQSISVSVIDAGDDTAVFDLADGSNVVINLAQYPSGFNLAIEMHIEARSLRFETTVDDSWGLDTVQNDGPYSYCGVSGGDYADCSGFALQDGHTYEILMTPYTHVWGTGDAHPPLRIFLEIIDDASALSSLVSEERSAELSDMHIEWVEAGVIEISLDVEAHDCTIELFGSDQPYSGFVMLAADLSESSPPQRLNTAHNFFFSEITCAGFEKTTSVVMGSVRFGLNGNP